MLDVINSEEVLELVSDDTLVLDVDPRTPELDELLGVLLDEELLLSENGALVLELLSDNASKLELELLVSSLELLLVADVAVDSVVVDSEIVDSETDVSD